MNGLSSFPGWLSAAGGVSIGGVNMRLSWRTSIRACSTERAGPCVWRSTTLLPTANAVPAGIGAITLPKECSIQIVGNLRSPFFLAQLSERKSSESNLINSEIRFAFITRSIGI